MVALVRRTRIWVKLSVVLTIELFMSLGVLALIIWLFVNDKLNSQLDNTLTIINNSKQIQINSVLTNMIQSSQLIASRLLIRQYLLASTTRSLNESEYNLVLADISSAISSLPDIQAIEVVELQQINLDKYNRTFFLNRTDVSLLTFQKYSELVATADGSAVTTYYNGTLFLRVIVPMYENSMNPNLTDQNRKVLGYLTSTMLAPAISRIVQTAPNSTDSSNNILGRTGEVSLAHNISRNNNSIVFILPPRQHLDLDVSVPIAGVDFVPMTRAFLGANGIYRGKDFAGASVTATYRSVGIGGWGIVTSMRDSELKEPIHTLRSIILAVLFGMFALSLIAAFLFARLFTQPIRKLQNVAQLLTAGQMDARITRKRPKFFVDEMVELGTAINVMADQIVFVYSNLEQKVQERTAQLEEARKQADAANSAKGYFLANMSHEIRTPLNGIVGLADICMDKCDNQELRDHLGTLKTSADHLMHLVNDILDYSKIDADKLELIHAPFNLLDVTQQIFSMFSFQAAAKDMQFVCTVDEDVPKELIGDGPRLSQILINLVGNAIKFTNQGGVTLIVQTVKPEYYTVLDSLLDRATSPPGTNPGVITHSHCADSSAIASSLSDVSSTTGEIKIPSRPRSVSLRPSASYQHATEVALKFCVQDTGIGITPEDQQKLFSAFSQVESTYNRKFGGTGLGLAICKKLVELMQGKIWIESTVNKGSTFWFTAVFKLNQQERTTENRRPVPIAFRPLNILVAEDNSVNQMVIKQVIKKLKHNAKIVDNGKMAVNEVMQSTNAYDLILMDIQMPEMDGIEATTIIRQSIPASKLPIVALTAHVTSSDVDKCYEVGIDYFITKPVDVKKLDSILTEIANKIHVP